ncbi:MAG TPA: tRNA uracil 4-sulfurtransferase ThiI [Candidatus Acidoferrum sp.]|nr:tRNA uracil 4-sulfurtransferase ThiI [Candidatus Acidoferrum sp.]
MQEIILLKYGELSLKGLNKSQFEAALMRNLKHRLKRVGQFTCRAMQSTVYVTPVEPCDIEAEGFGPSPVDFAWEECLRVFGFSAAARAVLCKKDMDEIKKTAAEYLGGALRRARTFKVESRRADKTFPLKSPEISAELGGALQGAFPHLKVDVHDPDVTVVCEIRDLSACIHADATEAAGGLPVATSGRGTLMLSGGIDSPVAGWMMARRGLRIDAVHFQSPPYTSPKARQKVVELAGLMSRWTGDVDLYIVPFTAVQEQIKAHCHPEFFTVIMRRCMVRIAQDIAQKAGSACLVTGESLGQVASQTMGGLAATDAVAEIPVLRPCIGMDKEDIVRTARKIGTFEKSIEPYEDCCALFSPKHPKTNPALAEVAGEEALFDYDAACAAAVRGAELVYIRYGRGLDPQGRPFEEEI